ncbi:CDP-alcohol phosphatidyltransferase family protein [Halomicrobium urmianum]|uniref:CDP-alcohol phosphatidyltransferase family protein n=1 Tax=Halomicrobium urmianum TaxID=1586233 RepID=UPI001CDA1870|nr:CDP-alcohol phosphatidyltransferase family protein [Halomicrobium urmianum]
MTLDRLRPLADRMLDPFVGAAARIGLTPDGISVVAFLMAVGAGTAFYLGGADPSWYLAGAALVFLNGWLDLLDGALARETSTSSRAGDLLDHVLDRYADIVMLVGLAAGIARYDLGLAAVTGVLMTSYLGTQAQAVDLDRVYGGVVGRADRLALIGLTAFVAPFVGALAYGLGPVGWLLVFLAVVGHFTALQRFYYSMRALP